jgi:hypothetical protein
MGERERIELFGEMFPGEVEWRPIDVFLEDPEEIHAQ